MSKPKKRYPEFEVYQGRNKKWYWRCYSGNGRIIADGGQGYNSERAAKVAVLKLVNGIIKTYGPRPNWPPAARMAA